MIFRTISDFLEAWQYESASTAKLLAELTGASLSQRVSEGGRSLGFIAWHIATTIPEMMGQAGIPVEGVSHESPMPDSAAAIAGTYKQLADKLAEGVKKCWTDAQLSDEIPMYGAEKWKKGFVLSVLVAHQTHHRGQMTVLMRQAGLKVPGVYGPAKEEWAAAGMPEQP